MKKLKDRAAIVTGGASGIGAGTALRLAEDRACVVVADMNESGAQRIVDEITGRGDRAIAVAVDVADEQATHEMIDACVEAFGRLDILHNNAAYTNASGQAADRDLLTMDLATWDKTMSVNLRGPMIASKYAIPEMLKNGGGSIINTSSSSAKTGDYERTAYAASKAAMLSLTRSIATQYGKLFPGLR
ncbi:MAG: SDR family NAD(P)-dependent oxidoreductase [Jatrophihabitans sp.]